MSQAVPSVRSRSIRVALGATALVALAYLAVAIGVVAITTADLTRQVDAGLVDALDRLEHEPPPAGEPFPAPPPRRPFGPETLVWTVAPDGTISATNSSAVLPEGYEQTTTPQTVTIGGTEVRIAGADVGPFHVVVGWTMENVAQARSTIIVAELIITPILLLVVFLGAVVIGRRVASPVELARRRQLEFTADASHELRTPLSVIEAQTSLALTQDRTGDWYRGAFARVDRESRRMRRLLDDLLWLARFDASRGLPDAEPVDLGVLAGQAADRFAIVAEARRVALSVVVDPGSHVVTAPPEWLDRLLGVLLDNAIRYSPEGGTVAISVAGDGARASVTVDDNGPGIPPEERGRIFDRFHRATDAPGGAGLGLSIADAIVHATNGRWKIGSSPPGGASMSVSWSRSLSNGRRDLAQPSAADVP
jgi:signal transduction histidine kinase